jgi:hypothetical protein
MSASHPTFIAGTRILHWAMAVMSLRGEEAGNGT